MTDLPYHDGGVGHSGSDTSKAAADFVAKAAPRMKALFEEDVRRCGKLGTTADEAAARHNYTRTQTQPRFSDLHRTGRIIDSGQQRPNVSGLNAIVWVTPEHASEEALAAWHKRAVSEAAQFLEDLDRLATWLGQQRGKRGFRGGAKLVRHARRQIAAQIRRKGAING